MKTTFFKPVIQALKTAGFEMVRQNNSHQIYRAPKRAPVTVPRKLDDHILAKRILRKAGLQ